MERTPSRLRGLEQKGFEQEGLEREGLEQEGLERIRLPVRVQTGLCRKELDRTVVIPGRRRALG
ncbi:hypothetical protein GCM10010448_21040 [Streptomyces glomeratus]|uniref:Uncharacterized protein n=1 Tax=Streptomyces glomeratus TaxID=284452 RepID=A0ABP6LB88_9ACTN